MKENDNEETFADIVRSWGFFEWLGIACIPMLIGGYFFFPDDTKKPISETQVSTLQDELVQSNSPFIQKDVLFLTHNIADKLLPQPISFQAIDINGINPYQVNVKNNWMIVTYSDGKEAARGIIKHMSSAEFNCLGFTQEDVIAVAIDKVKGEDTLVYDFVDFNPMVDYVVITSGSSLRQVNSIAQTIYDEMKRDQVSIRSIEGASGSPWILVDLNDVVVHVFLDTERDVYKLEKLYGDLKQVDINV